jgi:hypothetical protein
MAAPKISKRRAAIAKRRAGVRWEGPRIASKMRRAEIRGINVVMSRCVRTAKTNHLWKNRTGILEGSIGVEFFARPQGSGAAGVWGSADVVYARVHELGSEKLNIQARPYLRPAAADHYPELPREIRRAFK